MEWKTHLLSGVVAGYVVTGGDWKGAVIGGIAAIIPDLDEPESKFGKIFFFVSIPVGALFEHRTFTHSLLFTLLVGLISLPFLGLDISVAAVAGLAAHILGDMLTGKVKLLYPSSKSIGIPIPRSLFVVVDRITRYALLFYFIWLLLRDLELPKIPFAILEKLF